MQARSVITTRSVSKGRIYCRLVTLDRLEQARQAGVPIFTADVSLYGRDWSPVLRVITDGTGAPSYDCGLARCG
ncbi:MAG: hypothetical protein ACK5YR_01285 [Pirellula sp.]|jgi:hypothetical protein